MYANLAFFLRLLLLLSQNFQEGFAPKEAWSWAALSERFGDSMVRVSLSETGRCEQRRVLCLFNPARRDSEGGMPQRTAAFSIPVEPILYGAVLRRRARDNSQQQFCDC